MGNIFKSILATTTLILVLSVWCIAIANANPYGAEIIQHADSYLNVREQTNHNDNPKIDQWLGQLGLDNKGQLKRTGQGFAWCMAFSQGMYTEVYKLHGKKNPLPRSARCSEVWKLAKKDKYRYRCVTAKQVETGAYRLRAADVAIFSHKKTSEDFDGHTELVVAPTSTSDFDTDGGNVGAGNDAPQ